MNIHVIGVGATGSNYDGHGFSVGVNDAFKFGHRLNHLIVVNHPSKFSKEPDRMKTIVESRPDKFLSHTRAWADWFPDMQYLRLSRLYGRPNKTRYYHSQTSPYVAISHAFNLGATNIILWGVDFTDHKVYHEGAKAQKLEVEKYRRFADSLSKQGTMVWLGCEGSALNLPVWTR